MALEGAQASARGELPQLQRLVIAAREAVAAVGGNGHGIDTISMAFKGAQAPDADQRADSGRSAGLRLKF